MKNLFRSVFLTLLVGVYSNALAGWSEMYNGTAISLRDIWGSSSSDIFAVGYSTNDNTGIILHYDGSIWLPMEIGAVSPLRGAWGSSASDFFAVGDNGTIVHYDGSTWSTVESGTTHTLEDIWGFSSTDVFIVGGYGTILHYDGLSLSPMNCGTTESLFGVWGSSANDVFAVGSETSNDDTILHYDGINWSAMTGPPLSDEGPLYAVWGSSANDVYAVGNGWFDTGMGVDLRTHRIIHYDGEAWSEIWFSGGDVAQRRYTGVWGSSATNVFAVGYTHVLIGGRTDGDINNYDGANWSDMYIPFTSLSSVWGISSSDVFTVGDEHIYRFDGIPKEEDNCPNNYNPDQVDTDDDDIGDACDSCPYDAENDTDNDDVCGDVDNCLLTPNPDQLDNYPPQGNNIGDACDCEADFDCDEDVDGTDSSRFKLYFGRSQFLFPCTNFSPCQGDFECDGDVDGTDAALFKEDFGRSPYSDPCVACPTEPWCIYP